MGGVCLQVGLHRGASAYRGDLYPGVSASRGLCRPPPPRTRKVGGTHPTGMLSCVDFIFSNLSRRSCQYLDDTRKTGERQIRQLSPRMVVVGCRGRRVS